MDGDGIELGEHGQLMQRHALYADFHGVVGTNNAATGVRIAWYSARAPRPSTNAVPLFPRVRGPD